MGPICTQAFLLINISSESSEETHVNYQSCALFKMMATALPGEPEDFTIEDTLMRKLPLLE
jgi:hypothetical protein